MVLGTPLGISPSQALLRSCLQRAGFCPVESSKILYTIRKQVEPREKHPSLFLTENDYRTLNIGRALGLKHKKKRNSNLNMQGVSGSLQASCKTNFLFLLTCTPKAPIVCNVGFTQEYSLFWSHLQEILIISEFEMTWAETEKEKLTVHELGIQPFWIALSN